MKSGKNKLIERINSTSKADFVERLKDSNRKYIVNKNGDKMTHRLGGVTEDKHAVVYPEVQNINGSLKTFPNGRDAYKSAVSRGDTLHMSIPQAKGFTTHYKEYYPEFKQGGILKGQLGLANLPIHPQVVKRTYDKINNALDFAGKGEAEYGVKPNANLGPLMGLENPEAFAGLDLATIDPAHVGAKFVRESLPIKEIPSTTKISKPVVKQPTTKMEKGLHTYVKNKHPEDLANGEKYLDEYMKYGTKKKK